MRLIILTLLATLAFLVPLPGAAAAESICGAMYWGTDKGVYAGMCYDGEEDPYCYLARAGTDGVRQDGECIQAAYWAVFEAIREFIEGPPGQGLLVLGGGIPLP